MAVALIGAAVLGLMLAAVLVYLALTRSPFLFVADKLPGNLYSGADEVDELVTGSDGVDEAGQPDE